MEKYLMQLLIALLRCLTERRAVYSLVSPSLCCLEICFVQKACIFACIPLLSIVVPSFSQTTHSSAANAKPTTLVLARAEASAPLQNGVELTLNDGAHMRVTAMEPDIIHIQVNPEGASPTQSSWAVVPEKALRTAEIKAESGPGMAGFSTSALRIKVDFNPLRLVISDLEGNVLQSDDVLHPMEFHGQSFRVYKAMPDDEHFFGLGDKTGPLDRRGEAFVLWNTDAYAWQESTDPLYKAIPFFMGMHGGMAYGVFFDNTWRTSFDFGRELSTTYSFGSEGGALDYYFLGGPDPKHVVASYTDLTGHVPLPPLWTLGFQQSRYSYYPESRVREVAAKLRADKLPADTLYLDIHYQMKNRPFTVDPGLFPDMKKLVEDLGKQHFHLITITDLHVAMLPNSSYTPYDTGIAGDHFVKNPDGTTYIGKVWPGAAVFPDFTRKETRDWWGTLYKQFYVDDNIAGFWNDMNEPSIFEVTSKTMPLDTTHRIAEPGWTARTATHREIHNIFGMENSRATYDGLLKLKPDQRPFVLTRASYSGGQRYAATWTGDNSSTWNHLRLSIPQLLNLGISGFALSGDDIGGFARSPQMDLLTKWLEVGAFMPIYRDHTTYGSADQEPWVGGTKHEEIRRRYVEERYRLMPYLYTLAEEMSRTGMPMLRPMFMEFPAATPDKHPIDVNPDSDIQFMLGRSLLIAPSPYQDTLDDYAVIFPPGNWFDYWTGKAIPQVPPSATSAPDGSATASATVRPSLEVLPVYVRAGSILPRAPLTQSTDELPQGPLELRVYPGPDCQGSLYLDDGISFAYRQGKFLRELFTCDVSATSLRINVAQHTDMYQPWWHEIELTVYGAPSKPKSVTLNGAPVQHTLYDARTGVLTLRVPESASGGEVRVQY
jgi:alpha-glucosidase